jgi:hypothetical protein
MDQPFSDEQEHASCEQLKDAGYPIQAPRRAPTMTTQARGRAILPSLKYRVHSAGMATMLKTKFVDVTAGAGKTEVAHLE